MQLETGALLTRRATRDIGVTSTMESAWDRRSGTCRDVSRRGRTRTAKLWSWCDTKPTSRNALLNKYPINTDESVPAGACDSTPVDDWDDEKEIAPSRYKGKGFGMNFAANSMLTECWQIDLGKDRDHAL